MSSVPNLGVVLITNGGENKTKVLSKIIIRPTMIKKIAKKNKGVFFFFLILFNNALYVIFLQLFNIFSTSNPLVINALLML